MKTIFLALSFVSLFSGCTTGEKMSNLERGMTRQQVVAILGRPDAVRSNGPYEQLEYTNRLITGWGWDRSDFNVILKDGRVVEYGHGDIRNRSPQVVYTQTNVTNESQQPIIYPYQPQPQTQNINVRVQTPPSGPRSWTNPYGN
jgi:hypothetical protein